MKEIFYILAFISIIYYIIQWKNRIQLFKSKYNNNTNNKHKLNNSNNNLSPNIEKFNNYNPYCEEYNSSSNYINTGYYNEDDTSMYETANITKDIYLSNANIEEQLHVKRALHTYPLNRQELNKNSIKKYNMLKEMDNQVLSKEEYDNKYNWIDKIGQNLAIPNDFSKETKLEELSKVQTRTAMDTLTDYDEQKWNCQRIYQECGTRLHPNFSLKPYSYEEYDKFLDKLLNDY